LSPSSAREALTAAVGARLSSAALRVERLPAYPAVDVEERDLSRVERRRIVDDRVDEYVKLVVGQGNRSGHKWVAR
jgi:hypothetical protein